MPKWMIKGKPLSDYLKACKEADVSAIQNNSVLMRMFNTDERYQSHLENIVTHFGSLKWKRICEIGGGYGRLAQMIVEKFNPECYHIIDLPEVCELQQRYLAGQPIESYTKPTGQEYDLCISNYALSEIPDNKLYIDEVLRKSKNGYITCNTNLVKLDWTYIVCPDIKGERETNFILIW